MINEDEASDSCHLHVPATTIIESEEIVDANEEEEKEEQIEHKEDQVEHTEPVEPSADTSFSNDKEMSTEVFSFTIVPLETHHEPKASVFQCFKEPAYATILKDLCTQVRTSRNHCPKKKFRSKQVGHLRWQNILPEYYIRLKKKGWKGLDIQRIRESMVIFLFYFPHLIFEFFFLLFLVILFLFLTAINLLMFVSMRKYCC
jgi:magnesium-transporting ATPase (P-type)